ncbi:MAG: hypothetical protein IPM38_09310 [Ignavibacteria bacterium]|nr:hypothetical protein [Ignavibacteria bacterium]
MLQRLKHSAGIVTEKKEKYQKNKINYDNNLNQLEKISSSNSELLTQLEETDKAIGEFEGKIKSVSDKD